MTCRAAIAVLQLLYTGMMPQSGFFLKKKPPSTKPVRTYVLENRSIGRRLPFIAKPGMAYPETNTLKSTRPTARGPRRQVFVAGVERAATFDEANQATVSLVLL
jgi:hypothetical protein